MMSETEELYQDDVTEVVERVGEVDEVDEVDEVEETVVQSDRDEARAFREIDRDEEDKLVVHYKRTKDLHTLKKLLEIREQTIRYMAKKYAYLDNEDDMYSEFKGVWLRCVKRYDPSIRVRPLRLNGKILFDEKGKVRTTAGKTPFNTYLYTSMKHRVWNVLKHRHSKKLLDGNGDPVAETMRSLDYAYGEDGDTTLKDILPDTHIQSTFGKVEMAEVIRHLGGHDPDISRTITNFISNPHFDSLTAACNFRKGTLRMSSLDREVLARGMPPDGVEPALGARLAAEAHLKKMIAMTGTRDRKFEVIDYALRKGSVDFVIRVSDHRVLKKVKEAVLRCQTTLIEAAPHGYVPPEPELEEELAGGTALAMVV